MATITEIIRKAKEEKGITNSYNYKQEERINVTLRGEIAEEFIKYCKKNAINRTAFLKKLIKEHLEKQK